MSFLADDAQACLIAKAVVTEETPFGPDVLVYKVAGKMFATLGFEGAVGRMNLKCAPERALELREEWEGILTGYHMNKKHWNTLVLDGTLPGPLVAELIDHSYELVIDGMTKVQREAYENAC